MVEGGFANFNLVMNSNGIDGDFSMYNYGLKFGKYVDVSSRLQVGTKGNEGLSNENTLDFGYMSYDLNSKVLGVGPKIGKFTQAQLTFSTRVLSDWITDSFKALENMTREFGNKLKNPGEYFSKKQK